jgi:hypothetical protein
LRFVAEQTKFVDLAIYHEDMGYEDVSGLSEVGVG